MLAIAWVKKGYPASERVCFTSVGKGGGLIHSFMFNAQALAGKNVLQIVSIIA